MSKAQNFNLYNSLLYNYIHTCIIIGIFFSDSRPVYGNVSDSVEDDNGRAQNWDILIRNIKSFYQVSANIMF